MRHADSSFPPDPELETSDDKLTPLHFAARYIPIYRDETALQEDQEGNEATFVETRLSSSRRAVQYLVKICRVNINCQVGMSSQTERHRDHAHPTMELLAS